METYSTAGLECPHCRYTTMADGPEYFSDDLKEYTCNFCGLTSAVQIERTTAWRCEEIEDAVRSPD